MHVTAVYDAIQAAMSDLMRLEQAEYRVMHGDLSGKHSLHGEGAQLNGMGL